MTMNEHDGEILAEDTWPENGHYEDGDLLGGVDEQYGTGRHHWINTILGTLSASFSLTDREEHEILLRIGGLLDTLRIPERGRVTVMRADLATEVVSGHFSAVTENSQRTNPAQSIRTALDSDMRVPLSAWLDALTGLFTSSYPDLSPGELLVLRTELAYILQGLGLHDEGVDNPEKPIRVANFLPEDVMRSLAQTQ